jgi:hypothetical protein
MNFSALLNSDVSTLRVTAARAIHWWVAQLHELLPRHPDSRRKTRNIVLWDEGVLRPAGKGRGGRLVPRKGSRVWLTVPATLAFRRSLNLPQMSAADLRRLIDLEAERLSPLPASESLVGVEVHRSLSSGEQSPVDVAVLPVAIAGRAFEDARQASLAIAGFGLFDSASSKTQFDFSPALRARGLLAGANSAAAIWWCILAFLFILNVGILVVRDQQSVDRLQTIIEQQKAASSTARTLQSRAADFDSVARGLASQRRSHDVLAMLTIVSQDLPQGAWVQRFNYGARTARLVGYKGKDVDVAAAFRKDQRIASIRSNTSQFVSDTPAGQPFDITITLKDAQ